MSGKMVNPHEYKGFGLKLQQDADERSPERMRTRTKIPVREAGPTLVIERG